MDLAAATEIVRADMKICHGLGGIDWADDQVLYDFILGTTSPDDTYSWMKPELAGAYRTVHAHVYQHLAAETGDPHTLCSAPRCSLGESHTAPCNESAPAPK